MLSVVIPLYPIISLCIYIKTVYLSGWWFQTLWKILVSWGYYSQYMEKKTFQTTNQIYTGWWLTYPSEKSWSESQLGWWLFPTEWNNKIHVPKYQPDTCFCIYFFDSQLCLEDFRHFCVFGVAVRSEHGQHQDLTLKEVGSHRASWFSACQEIGL